MRDRGIFSDVQEELKLYENLREVLGAEEELW